MPLANFAFVQTPPLNQGWLLDSRTGVGGAHMLTVSVCMDVICGHFEGAPPSHPAASPGHHPCRW